MKRAALWFSAGLLLVLLLAGTFWLRYLPGPRGTIGHDYAQVLPALLAGDYFFARNGPFVLPWHSPAFGAGLPYYAHPSSAYLSLPQWLSFAVPPVLALQLTLLASVALAFGGTWLLLRRVFALSESSALLGSTLFALNGFLSARVLIGHLGFHSSATAPLIAFLLLRPLPEEPRRRRLRVLFDGLCAGLLLAYMFQSGNIYGLPPLLLAVGAIACLAALAGRSTGGFAPRLAFAGLIALPLCLEKLQAGLDYLASFPREGYPLPGARDALVLARILFSALFLDPPKELGNAGFEGLVLALERHEWEFGLSLVPVLLIGLALLRGVARPRALPLLLLVLVLAVPFAFNLHGERWTAFLKTVPILKSSSSFVRWFFAYVPFVAVLAALACERLRPARWPAAPALAASALAAFLLLSEDRGFYAQQPYDPRAIELAWQTRSDPPPIRSVVAPETVDGRLILGVQRNDTLVRGESQLFCYEPLFGYRLEWYPRGPVHAGDVLSSVDGLLNFHDPRLFLRRGPDGRGPGAPFRLEERAELERFLRYEPLAGSPSSWTPCLILLALAAAGFLGWKLRRAR
jgi:hypothetical protein